MAEAEASAGRGRGSSVSRLIRPDHDMGCEGGDVGSLPGEDDIAWGSMVAAPLVDAHAEGVAVTNVMGRRSPPLRLILVALDLLVVGAGWTAGMVAAGQVGPTRSSVVIVALQLLLVVPTGALLLSGNGLYRRRICQVRAVEVSRIFRTTGMLCGLLLLVVLPVSSPEEVLLGISVAGSAWCALLLLERGLLREWIAGRRADGGFSARVLVMGGCPRSTLEIAEFLSEHPVLGFEVKGVLCPFDEKVASRFDWMGRTTDMLFVAQKADVTGVVLDASSLNGELSPAVRALTEAKLHVHVSSGLRGVERRRITLTPMADETFLHIGPMGLGARERFVKRALDIVVAAALLLITAPVLLTCAMAIRLTDGGHVLYRQRRIGQGGEAFTLFKLRTMRIGADDQREALLADNVRDGPLFKVANDPRVSPIGRLLRATSIDELPQLLNVLEGTMSMVGPRPALPQEVTEFDEELTARLSVKPGVTGLWQVEARDMPSFDLYRRFDLLYVQNWSIGVDVAIIARTVVVVLARTAGFLWAVGLRRDVRALE